LKSFSIFEEQVVGLFIIDKTSFIAITEPASLPCLPDFISDSISSASFKASSLKMELYTLTFLCSSILARYSLTFSVKDNSPDLTLLILSAIDEYSQHPSNPF
jgi:hypothetical protein